MRAVWRMQRAAAAKRQAAARGAMAATASERHAAVRTELGRTTYFLGVVVLT